MNPILNKIDNDIRRKINEKTRDGKVHRKQKIEVNKDGEKDRKNFEQYIEQEKSSEKKKIIVDAVKLEEGNISLNGEKEESLKNLGSFGTFLDVKK